MDVEIIEMKMEMYKSNKMISFMNTFNLKLHGMKLHHYKYNKTSIKLAGLDFVDGIRKTIEGNTENKFKHEINYDSNENSSHQKNFTP